jgi:hypothetical protein
MTGLWWLPESPEVRVSGTLDQDPDGKFTLQTYSGLEGDSQIVGEVDIYGTANGEAVTMRKARWWRSQGRRSRETTREQYICWSVVLGVHYTTDLLFRSLDIQSNFLDGWIDRELWEDDISADGLKMLDYPNIESADYSEGKLMLYFGTEQSLGQKHWSISRNTSLSVHPHAPVGIEACQDHVQHFDSLIDIIFAKPTSAMNIRLHQTVERPAIFDGLRLRGSIAEPKFSETDRIHKSDGLCSFDELGGLGGIAKWFGLNASYRYLAGRITSHYRGEGRRYVEDRALTAFASGEALDRAESGLKNSTARVRWQRLAVQIPEFENDFIGIPVADWAHGLVEVRDDLAHILTFNVQDENIARMLAFLHSAHFLSMLSLLRIAGLGDSIAAMTARQRWKDERDNYQYAMRAAGLL